MSSATSCLLSFAVLLYLLSLPLHNYALYSQGQHSILLLLFSITVQLELSVLSKYAHHKYSFQENNIRLQSSLSLLPQMTTYSQTHIFYAPFLLICNIHAAHVMNIIYLYPLSFVSIIFPLFSCYFQEPNTLNLRSLLFSFQHLCKSAPDKSLTSLFLSDSFSSVLHENIFPASANLSLLSLYNFVLILFHFLLRTYLALLS